MAQRRDQQRKPAAAVVAATGDAGEPLSYERAVEELETIIERIEQGDIGLEESLRQFTRGDALVKHCRAILDRAEQQVRELAVTDDPTAGARPDSPSDSNDSEPSE